MVKKRRQYPKVYSDTAAGIRRIDQIDKLPSGQLTDEEFVKQFYERFDARALILIYMDETGQSYVFGRLHRQSKFRAWYKSLVRNVGKALGANINDEELE